MKVEIKYYHRFTKIELVRQFEEEARKLDLIYN